MTIHKYKSFEEAAKDLERLEPEDPIERLRKVWSVMNELGAHKKRKCIRGVRKFRSIEEAQQAE